MNLNLPKYKDEESFDILDPATQEPLGFKLTMARAGSAVHTAAQHKATNRVMDAMRKGARNVAQIQDAANLEVLIACTTGWEISQAVLAGEAHPPCTPENVREVFKAHDVVRSAAEYLMKDQESFRI